MEADLPKIDTSNLWDKTYQLLKTRIVRREYSPNLKLSIPELAAQLGVSRTPVRDALNRLEMDGLVKTVSKVGTFVCAISAEDVMEIMDTRLMLEYWVIEKLDECPAAQIEASLQKMEAILTKAEQSHLTQPDTYLSADLNLAFHMEFIKLGNNRNNEKIYFKLMDYRLPVLNQRLISEEMIITARSQHQHIIDAIRSGDKTEMKKWIKAHLDDSRDRLVRNIVENGGMI